MSGAGTPPRPIYIRPRAVADIEQHADYLEENATPAVTLRFRSSIAEAIEQIAFMPGVGAPREVHNARLSGLRMWMLPDFRNYLVFYITPDGSIEIVRVLHAAQDVQSILEDEE